MSLGSRAQFARPAVSRVVLAGLGAVAFALAGCSSGSPAAREHRSNRPLPTSSLADSSPPTRPLPASVLAAISTPGAPVGIVAAFGSIWVASHRGTLVYRIDPASNRVIAKIDIGQDSCGEPTVGDGRLFVGHCDDGDKVVVIDPHSNQVVASILGGAVTVTGRTAWVGSNSFDSLSQVSSDTYRLIKTVHIANGGGYGAVSGGGRLWLADINPTDGNYGGHIVGIDPVTGRVLVAMTTPQVGTTPWFTYAYGYLWLKGIDDGRLLRVAPATRAMRMFILAGFSHLSQFGDVFIDAAMGSLWMRTSDGTVSRVDPGTGEVIATYPADPAGGGGYPLVAFGSLWITNFGSDTVWRVRITH
jgi:streptogramin lyase